MLTENSRDYLGQVTEDREGAFGKGNVHGVRGAYGDGCLRIRKHDEVIARHWALISSRIGLHLEMSNMTMVKALSGRQYPEYSNRHTVLARI